MNTAYIYINYDLYEKLKKIKRQKNLSISTIVNIIKNHYQFAAARYGNEYKLKGTEKIHLKLKDGSNYPQLSLDCLTTNCLWEWNNKPNPNEFNYIKADSQIQSELDKTHDQFANYNAQIRQLARAARENAPYLKRIMKEGKRK